MSPRQRRASPHPASDRHSKRAGMLPPPPRPVSTSPARDIKRLAPRLDYGCAPAPDIAKGRDRRQPPPSYPFAGETPRRSEEHTAEPPSPNRIPSPVSSVT